MRNLKLSSFHFYFGILGFIIFVLTGQYMSRVYNHLEGMDGMQRLGFRMTHIYILFNALLHLAIGGYMQLRKSRNKRILQIVGSAFLFLGMGLLLGSFFTDLPSNQVEQTARRFGVYSSALGVAFHALFGGGRR